MLQETENEVKGYFESHNWKTVQDERGRDVFFKDRKPSETTPTSFLSYSKQKSPRNFQQLVQALLLHFSEYRNIAPVRVVSESEPFFVTSGVQRYEPFFNGNEPLDIPRTIQIQPVIRTNYRESVGEGNVSSFVNISTIASPVSPTQYTEMVDDWMKFLSSQGLFLPDFNITLKRKIPKTTNNQWDLNEGLVLSFNYGGLGIGDFGFLQTPNHPEEPIADLGIGLERLLWARNKNPSFGEVIGPLPAGFSPDMPYLDALRTTTLMAIAGVPPLSDVENQLRRYLPLILEGKEPSIQEGIAFYNNFWRSFVPSGNELEKVSQNLRRELNREKNLQLLRKLGHPKYSKRLQKLIGADQGEFIQQLLNSGFIKIEELRTNSHH